jgi:hypothetical protein
VVCNAFRFFLSGQPCWLPATGYRDNQARPVSEGGSTALSSAAIWRCTAAYSARFRLYSRRASRAALAAPLSAIWAGVRAASMQARWPSLLNAFTDWLHAGWENRGTGLFCGLRYPSRGRDPWGDPRQACRSAGTAYRAGKLKESLSQALVFVGIAHRN